MAAPKLGKTWTITPNLRNAYTSLADTTGFVLFENKKAMKLAGWTVKWTCDGATGPASDGDNTDRWASKADADTRGASAAAAQSFAVMQNLDGVQVLLTFQGASDFSARISFSPSGLFVRAGTVTRQPTATDEIVIQPVGNSIANSTTSGDRVITIWCSDDTKAWSCAIYRAGALSQYIGVEQVLNLCADNVFGTTGANNIPYVGFRFTTLTRALGAGNPCDTWANVAIGATNAAGFSCRVYTNSTLQGCRAIGSAFIASHTPGTSIGANATLTQADAPPLQGLAGKLMTPIYLVGERTANLDGLLGIAIDWWQMVTSSTAVPAAGDMIGGYEPADVVGVDPVRTNWLIALGGAVIRPWKNVAASLETT